MRSFIWLMTTRLRAAIATRAARGEEAEERLAVHAGLADTASTTGRN
jgi:hypothetical protein